MKKRLGSILLGIGSIALLGACAQTTDTQNSDHTEHNESISSSSMEEMHHHGSGEVPSGMKEAEDPKYPVGTKVKLTGSHMAGMENADAEVVGAYETTIYEVTYTPTTGGAEVKNHQWVVQEETEEANISASKGETVVLKADHMDGMEGATATVDAAINGTVYVVDYEPTDGGETVTNHMWMTENELVPE